MPLFANQLVKVANVQITEAQHNVHGKALSRRMRHRFETTT